ncbi:hypothetical protein GCM10008090_33850 [Arenicella chitinivorans]|uniref:Uncharacterized protein n=1 Tax=Arenicella chitinivorans TaxID=1329800 RepID=A0A918S4M6_9GAMM|nr:hypothetical protein [Arenicella chitinivorans]GHA21119.1 hypothetical protein GCM10008090_33850 [Arenicella chitinivorans]
MTSKHFNSWHAARVNTPVARVHSAGFMAQPGPFRGLAHTTTERPYRGTVSVRGLQGVGPAAYHFQQHHAVYPDERRHTACCEHPRFRAQHVRMQTWYSTTFLSYLYQSERRQER